MRVEAGRWVEREWPGWIEVRLREAGGNVALIVDKEPVLFRQDEFDGVFPAWIELPCDVEGWSAGEGDERIATIRLEFGLEDENGRANFQVSEADIVSRPQPERGAQ
ncbi:hypothetical protein JIG36_04205 [Actinoplanes sp. LDG1-06]|uniref:Uncharacterized protein n=1 Tax=Paractinoplanes ovalisporus TaxID=2810368 RepID=A0ABS2A4I6_9ACTN|nr:hypothetical protein [Actinoplanes ovalisporus]MBM2614757.1 hypothetical protein [Actinoplanes ovalisporus]